MANTHTSQASSEAASNSVLIECDNQEVKITSADSNIRGGPYSTFSGFLLYMN